MNNLCHFIHSQKLIIFSIYQPIHVVVYTLSVATLFLHFKILKANSLYCNNINNNNIDNDKGDKDFPTTDMYEKKNIFVCYYFLSIPNTLLYRL